MAEKNLEYFQPRKHQRQKQVVTLLLCVKNVCGSINTRDVSEGGVCLDLQTAQDLPDIKLGSIVSTRPMGADPQSARVGKVVRLDRLEVAIEYV